MEGRESGGSSGAPALSPRQSAGPGAVGRRGGLAGEEKCCGLSAAVGEAESGQCPRESWTEMDLLSPEGL